MSSGDFQKSLSLDFAHGHFLEFIWTLTPAALLWAIGLPSLRLLYLMDEILEPEVTIKILGSQWFWSYEYGEIAFDSYLVTDPELGDLRGLAVDNYLVAPINASLRLLVSSNDVIHSFALPSLAIKIDAIPGRLNSAGLVINRAGIYYGQCSELCGVLHGFMPIGLIAVN
jgi:cytochrome c oxidase subunit 2